ncbi:hypothetical protein K2173_019142 [Erythroxylum novogranatense]|uniref:Uncharacterized protein n=1 Tax=Erythroxylum novogranatense TaxID=1862640 RepID=A0AAV8STK6_9ROSI|nr:hypothetical protein K2173_019142 [Erythroxylum novogranatense]
MSKPDIISNEDQDERAYSHKLMRKASEQLIAKGRHKSNMAVEARSTGVRRGTLQGRHLEREGVRLGSLVIENREDVIMSKTTNVGLRVMSKDGMEDEQSSTSDEEGNTDVGNVDKIASDGLDEEESAQKVNNEVTMEEEDIILIE